MNNLYRYQSDPHLLINLETDDTEFLKERQKALQERIAKYCADLEVITDVIIERSVTDTTERSLVQEPS